MNATYGARWRANFPDEKSLNIGKVVWAQKLAGLTNSQLRRGIDACAMLADWNPSIAEFIRAACRLPSLNQCISRVLEQNNSDPVSYRIAAKIGEHGLRRLSYDQARAAIRSHYEDCYEDALIDVIGNDESFKTVKALPAESTVETPRADDETAYSNISEMRKAIGKRGNQ